MERLTKVNWDGNTVIIKNQKGTLKKTTKSMSLAMWKFKVFGEIPKGKRVRKVITN
jgi:hypothetical protein